MQLEAVAHIGLSVESALDRAVVFLTSRGYRSVSREPGRAVLRRGSLFGSLTGMTPARWKTRMSVTRLDASRVGVVVRANDSFQIVTEGERTFWADEIARVIAVLERNDPPPAGSVREHVPVPRRFFEGVPELLMITAAAAIIATALRGIVGLFQPLPFEFSFASAPWWKWTAMGALIGFAAGLRAIIQNTSLEDVISRIPGATPAEGETWEPPSWWTPAAGQSDLEGIVVVLDRDYDRVQEGVAQLLTGWRLPSAPIRVVVHSAAADRDVAAELAFKQFLIAGLRVDRAWFGSSPIEMQGAHIGNIVALRPPRDATSRARRIEWFDSSGTLIGLVLGSVFVAGGLWFAWDGLSRGRLFAGTDTSRTMHLVVETKEEISGFASHFRVSGRVAETGDQAEVGVFRQQFERLARGDRLEIYRRRSGQPRFVARRNYESAAPIIAVPGMPFSWQFFLGAIFIALGIEIGRSATRPPRSAIAASRRRGAP